MINIIIPCTPNYNDTNIINTVKKDIDIVSQFFILYNSIKQNWKFDYNINLFYNKNIPFNNKDEERLSCLDIKMFPIESDYEKTPYMIRCNSLVHNLDKAGTHKLLLDCDMIALKEPTFDLSQDWQAMYAGSVFEAKWYNYINKHFGYNLDLENKFCGRLFEKYIESEEHSNFFPHFNGGAFLIRESLCKKFKKYVIPSYQMSHNNNLPHRVKHLGVQYAASFSLMKISDNWSPFTPGFNYLLKSYEIEKFGKNNIELLHYSGVSGYRLAQKYFGNEINDYLR